MDKVLQKDEGFLGFVRKCLSHEAHPFVQFLKYGVVGVMATVVQLVVFYICAATVFKCLTPDDLAVKFLGLPSVEISETARALAALWATAAGFVVANIFCWIMNRLFVFKPGRHVWYIEFLLFFGVSLIAVGVGLGIQTLLIKCFGLQTSFAVFIEILSSLAINFVVRKLFVFKG